MTRKATDTSAEPMKLRPVCLACTSFDVEAVVDGEPAELQVFACFECQDVLYFMADAAARTHLVCLLIDAPFH